MDELFDTFSLNGEFLGVKPKSFCHSQNPGVYHKPVWIWIYNDKGEVLVQKRSSKKKNFPNLFDMPSAGHVDAGERPIDACVRETFEELGIKVEKEKFIFEGEILNQIGWELAQVYSLKLNIPVSEMKLSPDEVECVKWLNFDEFEKLFYSNEFVPFEEDYRKFVIKILKEKIKLNKAGKIYLTSGGYIDGQRGEELDKIIESSSRNKNVLIVDNATTTGSNSKGKSVVIKDFSLLTDKVDVITLTAENLENIKEYDVIYILGGDVTPLIELANSSYVAEVLKEFVKNGGVIFGESAGSMIFGKDLEWIYEIKRGEKPKWDVQLKSYKGFGLFDVNIFPHWNKARDDLKEKATKYEQENNIVITRLVDGDWLEFNFDE